MKRIAPRILAAWTARALRRHGVPVETAAAVAASLVAANLAGHDSHGVMRLPRYLEYIRSGRIVPAAEPVVLRQAGATGVVDGRWGFGQAGGRFAGDLAAEIAAAQGFAAVALRNVMHLGRLGEYVEELANKGWVALVFVSNGGPHNAVAPFGGRDRLFGTNPLAFGCPGPRRDRPLVVDFATAATAEGKLALARSAGRPVEAGLLVDRAGRPSTDPSAFYAGGALLPFGGHKGYGVMVMVEVLGRILTGHLAAPARRYMRLPGNAALFLVCDPERFGGRRSFQAALRLFARAVTESRPCGRQGRVLLPGEPEAAHRARRRAGIPVPAALQRELQALAGG